MAWDKLLAELTSWLERRDLLRKSSRWVVGASGGLDSTALLYALSAISETNSLDWKLHVAHFHHKLRGEAADLDESFVRGLAERTGAAFLSEQADVSAIVASEGGSTEEVARRLRYEFLERAALKTGSDLVAVAHHADDDAETVLHRVCRGTGLRGLAGMRTIRAVQPGSRIRLVRPLLHQHRATIEAACRERQIEWREDATNLSSEFTRGKIRNAVLPILRDQLNQNVAEALLRLAEQARWVGDYLDDAAARTFDSLVIVEDQQRVVLNNHGLQSKQRIVQAEVVRRTIAQLTGGERDINYTHIESVLRLASDSPSGKELHLPNGLVARKIYDRLEFQRRTEPDDAFELNPVVVQCPGKTPLPALNAQLIADIVPVEAGTIESVRTKAHANEEWLDYERVQLPLIIRSRRAGDRFWPLGAPGSKTLGDFLGDEKIDPALRARTGVLCDQNGPVWVMPLRIDQRVRLRSTSRQALRVKLTGQTTPGLNSA